MMKRIRRFGELLLILLVVAVSARLLQPAPSPPAPDSQGFLADGPSLSFNNVRPGEKLVDLEARLGPPDFKNAQARYQQWEAPLTQLNYSDQGIVLGVGGSGTGVLRQGDRVLLRCGYALERDVVAVFGPPPGGPRENFYRYPGLRWGGGYRVDLAVHCGSESEGVRSVSHIQLGVEGK